MRGRVRYPLYGRFWGRVLRTLCSMFVKVNAQELGHVPASGAGIIYYNHIHWLDPVVVCRRLRRYVVPWAKMETSRWPVLGWLLRWYGSIFIRRGEVDRAAFKATWAALDQGYAVVVAPEGTRSHNGKLQRAKEGLAFIARRAPDAWLVPAAVTGTTVFEFARWQPFQRPSVHVLYGRPVKVRWPRTADGSVVVPGGREGRQFLEQVTDQAMAYLASLLPEDMRGDYAAAAGLEHDLLAPYEPFDAKARGSAGGQQPR